VSAFLISVQGGVRLRVQVQPGASKSEIVGLHGDRLKVRIHSPPVDGKANEALIEFFAELFGIGKTWVKILAGATARSKTIEVIGVDEASARKFLLAHIS
jgi:uncharacterized protein (TIGR00251 family)